MGKVFFEGMLSGIFFGIGLTGIAQYLLAVLRRRAGRRWEGMR